MSFNHGWLKARNNPSLIEVFRSVPVPKDANTFRRFLAFVGPGFMVAVGYMDPGNWATSIAGGSGFGYTLLFVALLSNIMAILLQSLCTRLGIATGRDLAQACRDAFPSYMTIPLWLLAEAAIIATDLAEVIGTAIALNLLFHIPMGLGVLLTAADVFIILWLQNRGFRWLESFVISLLALIAICFGGQIFLADPVWSEVFRGFIPSSQIITNPDILYLALGIIGATVMPHNLYLHSGIVQTRAFGDSLEEKRDAIRLANWDGTIALMMALFINASILILAATLFHKTGRMDVAEIDQAYNLLTPILGVAMAPILFGIALLCCGLNSTVTATMSGQIVMEGFINFRVSPVIRRLITRLLAIIPAVIVIFYFGPEQSGKLLILSQVVLSLQLPFAIVPLVLFTANRKKMGDLTAPRWLSIANAIIAAIIIGLNLKFLSSIFMG